LRPDPRRLREPEQAAKAALRSLARRIAALDGEIKLLDQQLAQLVAEAAPITLNRVAVGTAHAATLLVTAGQNIERLRHEPSFAALCAAGPVPVSSGRTDRHRLNYGGDRDANRALHMIAVCRLRYCQRTRAYAARRTAEGKTKTEIIRCLKRYIARELYHALVADLLPQPASPRPPAPTVSVTCGAGPIGRTIRS
jgi:transposase